MTRIVDCGTCLDDGIVEERYGPGFDLCPCLDGLREEVAPSSPPAGCSDLLAEGVGPQRSERNAGGNA